MSPDFFHSPLTALVAGFVTSAHCVGMCGPLACATTHRDRPAQSTVLYHAGRFVAYALVGGLAGWLGGALSPFFQSTPVRWLPVAFVLFFVAVAFGWDKKVKMPSLFARLKIIRRQTSTAPLLLGLATPFLPCAPLYLAVGVALFAGSFVAGATLLAAFALGTMPALFLLQWNWFWISGKISPTGLRRIQQALALAAAAMILWRSLNGVGFQSAPACPLCH